MTISIKITPNHFKSRASLVKAKETKPSKDSITKSKEVIGYRKQGHYMVAIHKEEQA